MRCRLFSFKKENIFVFSLKKSATHFPWKNIGNPRRELGRELEGNWERERELEKHSTSYTLKKKNWKNTAFSITPGELEKHGIFNRARERELEKHGIFNHTREREVEKHSVFNHAQEREQQQQHQQQQQEQEQEQKQVGRTNTDVKQKNALAQYLSVHHH